MIGNPDYLKEQGLFRRYSRKENEMEKEVNARLQQYKRSFSHMLAMRFNEIYNSLDLFISLLRTNEPNDFGIRIENTTVSQNQASSMQAHVSGQKHA